MSESEIREGIEKLQDHHISYDPEIKETITVKDHVKFHGHGTGIAKGESSNFKQKEKEFVKLWEQGATYSQIMRELDISFTTVANWRRVSRLKKRRNVGDVIRHHIVIYFNKSEFDEIQQLKGDRTWEKVVRDGLKVGDEK